MGYIAYLTITNVAVSHGPHQKVSVNFANGDHVELTAEDVRRMTDPAFAKRIEDLKRTQDEHIGLRVRILREERGLACVLYW